MTPPIAQAAGSRSVHPEPTVIEIATRLVCAVYQAGGDPDVRACVDIAAQIIRETKDFDVEDRFDEVLARGAVDDLGLYSARVDVDGVPPCVVYARDRDDLLAQVEHVHQQARRPA